MATIDLTSHTDVPVEEWAARIYEARRARRLSQRQLARQAGICQQTVSKIESADSCPSDQLKIRLARALEMPPHLLFPWPAQDLAPAGAPPPPTRP